MAKVGLLRKACILSVVCVAMVIAAPAQSFCDLFSFDNTDGAYPVAELIQGTDGNFYGTTRGGGAYGLGEVFEITPTGTMTTLHSFEGPEGGEPVAGLIQASDGNFYGTTLRGGAYGGGAVFKMSPGGTLTTLYSFCAQTGCPDGEEPEAGLIQATDGDFYGTTRDGGGSYRYGTIFKITSAGTLTTLYVFSMIDGGYPVAGLIQASDGNFYGTTSDGGASAICYGTIFKITPAGSLTTLHSFGTLPKCSDGGEPQAKLIQANDGNFYGTTMIGGANHGTVFRITPSGTLTTLHSFCQSNCADGASPLAGLIQASDGNLYGTTQYGANGYNSVANGYGTAFEVTTTGTLITLYSFCAQVNCADGALPQAALVQATDGSFYGTAGYLGADDYGTVFRLAVAPAVTLAPGALNFGNQALDQPSPARTVMFKNSGTALLMLTPIAIEGSNFAISANTCGATLAPGKTCTVHITFTPVLLGNFTGTVTFTDNASNSPQTVTLSGTGSDPVTLAPASVGYGSQAAGTTSTAKTFSVTNNQSVELTGFTVSTTGDFAVSTNTCPVDLRPQGKCAISVTFTPTALGNRTGTLSVSDSASNSPQTAALTGTGLLPAALTPASATYSSQTVGTTSLAKTFTLTNNQTVALTIVAISTSGDFAVSATTCTTSLVAKSKCTISVTFTPTATGTQTGQLSASFSANNSPQTSDLTGTGK